MVEVNGNGRRPLWRDLVGAIPTIIAVVAVGYGVLRATDRNALEIQYLQQADVRHEAMLAQLRSDQLIIRGEILNRMDNLAAKIEELQKTVASKQR